MNQYHFISGLPRAGSTRLSALLRQNPAVSAGISSPVTSLVSATLKAERAPGDRSWLCAKGKGHGLRPSLLTASKVAYEFNQVTIA